MKFLPLLYEICLVLEIRIFLIIIYYYALCFNHHHEVSRILLPCDAVNIGNKMQKTPNIDCYVCIICMRNQKQCDVSVFFLCKFKRAQMFVY